MMTQSHEAQQVITLGVFLLYLTINLKYFKPFTSLEPIRRGGDTYVIISRNVFC